MSETGLFFLGWALVGYGSMMGVYCADPFDDAGIWGQLFRSLVGAIMAPGAVARLLMMDGYFYLGAICSALWFVIVGIAGILPLGWWLLGICLLLGFTTAVLLYPIVKHDMAD